MTSATEYGRWERFHTAVEGLPESEREVFRMVRCTRIEPHGKLPGRDRMEHPARRVSCEINRPRTELVGAEALLRSPQIAEFHRTCIRGDRKQATGVDE